jgi:UDP-N-acetylmuramyl pentapeptide phosphotransferase/UDP-N-acetylglucosamine-1-phosphate transferase
MNWLAFTALVVLTALATWFATGRVLQALLRHAVLDYPNARSSHATPTPRGGGIAVLGILTVVWAAIAVGANDHQGGMVLVLGFALGLVSWFDDLNALPVAFRLAAQAGAVALGVWLLLPAGAVFQGILPPAADAALTGLVWLWFVNLYNFMDGIDGIAGVETVAVGSGLVAAAAAAGGALPLYPAVLAAAALGFLRWNWPPARIFLGDVGSIPLGYLSGWLLLAAAAKGMWATALLLPLYFLADATLTLGWRLARREKVWQAHRDHFYQRAARRFGGPKGGHRPVVLWVLGVNAILAVLAALAASYTALAIPCVAVGGLLIAAVLWYFAQPPGGKAALN